MDLGYIFQNTSASGPWNMYKRPDITIPYLSIICLATVSGTLGNLLVIATVLTNKVHYLNIHYSPIIGTGHQLFPLFVSCRFTSNKTQLSEFPEQKSDMPLFHWVLVKIKRKKQYVSKTLYYYKVFDMLRGIHT